MTWCRFGCVFLLRSEVCVGVGVGVGMIEPGEYSWQDGLVTMNKMNRISQLCQEKETMLES